MKNISYRSKLLTIYVISIFIVSFFIYNLLSTFQSTNIEKVSKEHFKNKSLEREAYLHDFFYPYFTIIKSIHQSELLKGFLSNEIDRDIIENYFLDLKKSLPCLLAVKYVNTQGVEKVKASGYPIGLKKDKHLSKIIKQENLKDISYELYIEDFLNLKNNKIGLSKIELNEQSTQNIKQPVLRMGMSVFDKNNKQKGVIVLEVCLKTFFKLINRTTLYYIHLIDDKGFYLDHHDSRYGLTGKNSKYTIFDEFNNAKKILENDEYFGGSFFSYKIKNFENKQNIKIILKLKFNKQIERSKDMKNFFIIFSILFGLLLLILSIYFSKLPDLLKEKAKKDKLINKLTSLPNRLALLNDLSKQEFENSIIILLSINNLQKIQNTYGYEISNKIIQQLSEYLKEYKHIKKIYINANNSFSLKYKYKDEKILKEFLNKLIKDIGNHQFEIMIEDQEVDFILEIAIGVSNPNKLNNSIEELSEAENALQHAIEKNKNIEIFSSSYNETIQENKRNIILAKQIKQAIEDNNIILHYQAIYNNFTQKIEKYESLIRMKTSNSLIYPDEFLPIAKQINKYNTLTYIVIDKAFKFFHDKPYDFSINLSISDVENRVFQDYLFERIEYYKVKNKVVLEIVEQEGIENYDEFLNFLKKAKEHGCKIAIDDFGSGYSNFAYIINMSEYIDYIKIDGSLIKNIHKDSNSQILVGSLKFLCDNLNIKTIAEFVENEEILTVLHSIGVDYSQGYHIGKPNEQLLENNFS